MRPQKTISLSMKHHSRSRRVLSVFQCIYTCSSMRSTAVWLQSNHWKHPLKSGVNAGPRVEHFYFYTHAHTRCSQGIWQLSRAPMLFYCVLQNNRHTHAVHSALFVSAFKGHINREEENETKREEDERRGTLKCRLGFIRATESPRQPKQNEIACADLILSAMLF